MSWQKDPKTGFKVWVEDNSKVGTNSRLSNKPYQPINNYPKQESHLAYNRSQISSSNVGNREPNNKSQVLKVEQSQISIGSRSSSKTNKPESQILFQALQYFFNHSSQKYQDSLQVLKKSQLGFGTAKRIKDKIVNLLTQVENYQQLKFDNKHLQKNQQYFKDTINSIANSNSYQGLEQQNSSKFIESINKIIRITNAWKILEKISHPKIMIDIQRQDIKITQEARQLLKSLIKSLKDAEKQKCEYGTELNSLKAKLEKKEKQCRQLQQKSTSSEQNKNKSTLYKQNIQADYLSKLQKVKSNLENYEKQSRDLQKRNIEKTKLLQNIQVQIKEKSQTSKKLQQEIRQQNKRVIEGNKQLQNNKIKPEKLDFSKYEQSLEIEKQAKKELEKQIQKLNEENRKLSHAAKVNESQLNSLQKELKDIKYRTEDITNEKDVQIAKLSKKIKQWEHKFKELEERMDRNSEQLQNQIQQKNSEIKVVQSYSEELSKEIANAKKVIENYEQKINILQQQRNGKSKLEQELTKKYQEKNLNCQSQMKLISELKSKAEIFEEKISLLERTNQRKDKEVQQIKANIKEVRENKDKQIQRLKTQINEKHIPLELSNKNNREMMENMELLKKDIETAILRKDQVYAENNRLHIDNNALKLRAKELEDQPKRNTDQEGSTPSKDRLIRELKDAKAELEAKVKALEKEQNSPSKNKLSAREESKLSLELSTWKEKAERLEKQAVERGRELKERQLEIDELREELEQASKSAQMKGESVPAESGLQSVRYLFHGEALRGVDEHKLFIKNSIEELTRVRISDTRLIYRFDPLNRVNLHKYIDEKEQLVVVLQLSNYKYMAAYCEGFFKPKTPASGEGMLMSLTNRECYYLSEKNRKATVYDDFFLIFGNSEVRIKTQQKKVFSNFGLNSNYYKNRGHGVAQLFGETVREIEFQEMEIFQLILQR